jgi:hypothetical protein
MTSEHRTLIELVDITGIEFECKNCTAKILYPLQESYKRLSEQCPNCLEPWFAKGSMNPNVPTPADEVKKIFATLHKVATSPQILAQVRLCIVAPDSPVTAK